MSRQEGAVRPSPVLLGMDSIRTSSLKLAASSLTVWLLDSTATTKITTGWTGTIHMKASQLAQEIKSVDGSLEQSPNRNDVFVVGGYTAEAHDDQTPASLLDKNCQIPVHFSERKPTSDGSFVIAPLEDIVVSCFCMLVQKSDSSGLSDFCEESLMQMESEDLRELSMEA